MKLMELLISLATLLREVRRLLDKAGFSEEDEAFTELEWERNDVEALYYVQFLETAARTLFDLQEEISAVQRKPKDSTSRLHRLSDGRFGYKVSQGWVKELTCGSHVEALIDVDGRPYWLDCRIEHANDDYYICSYHTPMEGLMVREPR